MKIFDAIHGFIELDDLETKVIRSLPFKRLGAIHQIAAATFVYSGGHHKRFDHSLGVMQVVSEIYDKIVTQKRFFELFPDFDEEQVVYWRRVMRLSGLCHDIGHLPLSHTAEEELIGKKGHEKWTMRILRSPFIKPLLDEGKIHVEDVVKLAVGEEIYGTVYTPWEKVLSEILTADYFGGDRIDYLLRDSYFTGLAYGNFDHLQLIENLTLLMYKGHITLGLEENGLESCYAMLLARYFMHRRLYQYHRVRPYWYHLKEFLKDFFYGKKFLESVSEYIQVNDYDVFSEINKALFDKTHKSHSHARALMDQQDLIQVLPVSLEEIQYLMDQGENHFFEKNPFQEKMGLFFPVLLKNGMIVQAEEVAEVSIPVCAQNWVFADFNSMTRIRRVLGDAAKHKKDFI